MFLLMLILFSTYIGNGDIIIKDQWMRPGAEKMATALYFKIENSGSAADTLYSVSSDVSKMVQIHETFSSGDMMGMKEVEFIVVEPNSQFQLKPGSHHIMVMKLLKDISVNEEVEFTLHFKIAGDINIIAKAIK